MSDRIHSIDAGRAISMAFIVAVHADAFRGVGVYGNVANFVIDTTGRFAVPFFFLTAGYLIACKLDRAGSDGYVVTYLRRVTSIYGWALLFYAPLVIFVAVVTTVGTDQRAIASLLDTGAEVVSPLHLIYYGDSVMFHLWFLPALAFSVALVYAIVTLVGTRYLLPIAIAFHAVGILAQSQAIHVPFETRDALFFGFFYTSVGYYLGSWNWSPKQERRAVYLGATVVLAFVHLLERYFLGYVLTDASIRNVVYAPEYTLTTAFFATALFLFLLSTPSLGESTRLPTIGTYAVVIYVVHPVVLFGLDGAVAVVGFDSFPVASTVLWQFLLTPLTYCGTLGVYALVARTGVLGRIEAGISLESTGSSAPETAR